MTRLAVAQWAGAADTPRAGLRLAQGLVVTFDGALQAVTVRRASSWAKGRRTGEKS